MEKDFHYFLTYAMAKMTECPQPEVIAYACQFVDDNNEGQFFVDGEKIFFPEKLKTADRYYYYPVMTQSLSPKSLDPYVQKYVYLPFHFLPGDNNVTIKGSPNPLNTTPNSGNAKKLLSASLESDNPYLIGIALHTFADTWSHQNFTGMQEEWNAVYPWYNGFKSIVPNIGHAEAGHSPDVISEPWIDYRIGKTVIDNKERAFAATRAIYENLQKKTRKGTPWNDVKGKFQQIIDADDYDERIAKISALMDGSIPGYSRDAWIGEAIDKDAGEVSMKPGYTDTDWYRFHQAAKIQLSKVAELTKEI